MPSRQSALLVGAVIVALLVVGGFAAMPSGNANGVAVSDDDIDDTTPADDPRPTGDSITVAVVDTGIDDSHAALEGQVVDRIDLTDDGADAEGGVDKHGHGTHVAGVVAGQDVDGAQPGVAPGADLVDVRVLSEEGEGDAERIAEGITYAVEEADADIVLLSLNVAGVDDEPIDESVARATDQGAVVVASAGNTGATRSITTPGRTPEMITVGATAENGSVLSHSSRGPTEEGHLKPELVAPGQRIPGPDAGTGTEYTTRTGTSLAAPQVAGAAALVLEAEPELPPAAVESRLVTTARPIPDADVFAAGGGELDVDRALEPGIVVHDGVLDFGLLEDDAPVERTVTVENRDDRPHELTLETSIENLDADGPAGPATGETLSANRTDLSLDPGETADIALTADADTSSGVYSGALAYTVDGEARTAPVGFVRGGTLTVEKRPFSDDDRIDGDPLFFFTEEGTHSGIQDFEDGETSFVAGSGTYVLWTRGVDQETGSIIFVSERIDVDGTERVVLDEAETDPIGVDAGPLVEAYGPLENHTIAVSMSATSGDQRMELSRTVLDADNRTVRVSSEPSSSIATTYLLTTDPGGAGRLEAGDVFQLSHEAPSAGWSSPVTVEPADLETTEHRLHRTTADIGPEVQDRTVTATVWNNPARYWFDAGTQDVQHVHRNTDRASHERRVRGDGWQAVVDDRDAASVDILAHPMIAQVESLSVTDGTATVEGEPLADGAGTAFDPGRAHAVSLAIDDEIVTERETDALELVAEAPVEPGESVTARLEGNNSDGRLSTRTVTEVRIDEYDPERPHRAPLVSDVDVDADTTNAAGPGETTVAIDATELRSVFEPIVWYTTEDRETAPWADPTGWNTALTGYADGQLLATLEVPEDAATVSLAAELEAHGDRTRLLTTDAFYAGAAPNTSTRTIEGHLQGADGTPVANDSVLATPVDGDSPTVTRTDADGAFALEVPRDETYDLEYRRGEPWRLNASLEDDRPALAALEGVTVGDEDVALERTLPAAEPFDPHVVDERGEPVSGARVELEHRGDNVTVDVAGESNDDGRLQAADADRSGLSMAGSIGLTVIPPEDGPYVQGAYRANRTVGDSPEPTVVLETEPPEAALETNRNWMLEGTPVTLDAGDSDVPAGVAAYRWDLDGDGSIDRTTDEARIRHELEPGETELRVTVVDDAGKTDTAQRTVQVDPLEES
ncbi:hypothetical protein D8Y22_00715 [Salinadaptatus halalkaliphilus]|uniref:Peptidase S8/S53 domain-containing protein n=1 Tax=Salinadaptatus halalkaliphilus TaxID=2419781 RepID=A0A4V3VLS0_9EURY|nr:S8 family serine peptidase [Salinadaptatus halalkaliphilus]THE66687.1 hypothetical protein D8Y22_00715 [Salinadaptatus halalkaliphilus]